MDITGRIKRYYTRVMEIPDAPGKIAKGAALGLALDFLPIPLISIPIAYVIARLAGGNGLAAALTAAFFKWAVPFFYMLNMATGSILLGYNELESVDEVKAIFTDPGSSTLEKFTMLGYPFLAGALLNSVVAFTAIYLLLRKLLYNKLKHMDGIVKKERAGKRNLK